MHKDKKNNQQLTKTSMDGKTKKHSVFVFGETSQPIL